MRILGPAPAGRTGFTQNQPLTQRVAGGISRSGSPRGLPTKRAAIPLGRAGSGLAGPLRRKVRGLFKAGRAVCFPKEVTGGGIE